MSEVIPEDAECIGMASMDVDRNVILELRATDGQGSIGMGRLVYTPDHEQYKSVITHLGGLNPGESKPVRPFPTRQ